MTTIDLSRFTFCVSIHRNQVVLWCRFPFDHSLLASFKKDFPSAKWSRPHKGWYLPNSTLYRKRLNLPLPEIGDAILPKLCAQNKKKYIKFRNALFQKQFSPQTIKTYLDKFASLLVLLKSYPVIDLSVERLNSYFLYCTKKLNHSEAQIYSRMNARKSYFKLVLNRESDFKLQILTLISHAISCYA